MKAHPGRAAGWGSVLALASTLLVTSVPATAQGTNASPSVQGALQRLKASDPRPWEIAWDAEFEQVESVTGHWRGTSSDPGAVATDFLRTFADVFELQPDLADVAIAERRTSLTGTHLVFRQTWSGLPVFDGGIDVHVSKGGEVFLVSNRYVRAPTLARLGPTPNLSAQDVIEIVRGAHARLLGTDKTGRPIAPPPLVIASAPELGVHRGPKTLELAYRIVANGVRYVVGAQSGAILEQTSLVQSVGGTGQVFNPNPVNQLRDTGLRDQSDSNYAALQGAYQIKALKDIQKKGTPAEYKLVGPYVRMFNATGVFLSNACGSNGAVATKPPPVRADADFIYTRNQPEFEHTNVYYHLDKSQRYIQSLGITVLDTGIAVDAHAFGADNSYFCPASGGYLAFGDGGVDDAEDADVVLHEYGHAIQHYSSGGRYAGNGHPGAMGEGFGDYWAFSAKPTGFDPACFAEFDVNDGTCLRRLDRNKKFPADFVNEVHADGEIWSQALREIFRKIDNKQTADTIILESHFLIALSPTFSKGAKALVDADDQLYGGANKNAICSALIDRGITTAGCGLWIKVSWTGKQHDVDLHLRHPDGYDYPGYDHEKDCAYYNENPDWGVVDDPSDNPLLYEDCVSGCTAEKIVSDNLTEPGLYAVLVHFFQTPNPPATTKAILEIYQGSKRAFVDSKTIANTDGTATTGELWFPVDIEVGATKDFRFNAVGTVRKMPALGSGPAK